MIKICSWCLEIYWCILFRSNLLWSLWEWASRNLWLQWVLGNRDWLIQFELVEIIYKLSAGINCFWNCTTQKLLDQNQCNFYHILKRSVMYWFKFSKNFVYGLRRYFVSELVEIIHKLSAGINCLLLFLYNFNQMWNKKSR